ncbi:MAG: HlyD family efflux transporter periplasmic adaptor subunit [Erysipelotrichaceae bacterium]
MHKLIVKFNLLSIKQKGLLFSSIVICICGIVSGYLLLSKDTSTQEITEKVSYTVETMVIEETVEDSYLNYMGLIQPSTTEQVTFATVGTVKKIYVEEGDYVQAGQLLVTLDTSQLESQLENNEEILEIAENNYTTAAENLEDAQADYDALESEKEATLASYQQSIDEAKENINSLQNDSVLLQALNTAKSELEVAQSAQIAAQSEVDVATSEVDIKQNTVNEAQAKVDQAQAYYQALVDAGATEDEKAQAQVSLDEANSQLTSANSELSDAELTLTQKQEALTLAENEVSAKQSAVDVAQVALDNSGYDASLSAAQAALEALEDDYDSQSSAYDTNLSVLQGQVDSAEYLYNASESTYLSAKSNYEGTLTSIESYSYYASKSGTVVMIVSEEGSVATPLSPVLVVASDTLEAQFGISPSEISSVKMGNSAFITIKDEVYTGKVTAISALPDETSRTYLVDVQINTPPDDALLGELVSVKLYSQETTGVWIPISVILNDISDYVYVVENNRVVRREVSILEIKDDQVMVSNLYANDEVICSNMSNVKSGYLVNVVNKGDQDD